MRAARAESGIARCRLAAGARVAGRRRRRATPIAALAAGHRPTGAGQSRRWLSDRATLDSDGEAGSGRHHRHGRGTPHALGRRPRARARAARQGAAQCRGAARSSGGATDRRNFVRRARRQTWSSRRERVPPSCASWLRRSRPDGGQLSVPIPFRRRRSKEQAKAPPRPALPPDQLELEGQSLQLPLPRDEQPRRAHARPITTSRSGCRH